MNTPRQPLSYPLRIAPELRAQLEEIAKQHGRSLNAEIALRLEASMQTDPTNGSNQEALTARQTEEVREIVREELQKTGKGKT